MMSSKNRSFRILILSSVVLLYVASGCHPVYFHYYGTYRDYDYTQLELRDGKCIEAHVQARGGPLGELGPEKTEVKELDLKECVHLLIAVRIKEKLGFCARASFSGEQSDTYSFDPNCVCFSETESSHDTDLIVNGVKYPVKINFKDFTQYFAPVSECVRFLLPPQREIVKAITEEVKRLLEIEERK